MKRESEGCREAEKEGRWKERREGGREEMKKGKGRGGKRRGDINLFLSHCIFLFPQQAHLSLPQ